jgi:hypothetical protein
MDILISILIAGFASGYFVEFASSLLSRWFAPRTIKLSLTFPLSLIALWLLGITDPKIFVYACASGFVSLAIMAFVSKPVEVTQVVNRR